MSTINPNQSVAKQWEGDLFERSKSADLLYSYLSADYKRKKSLSSKNPATPQDLRGLVMALTADWGFGKTYFIDDWSEALKGQGHPVVKFNAWESDFSSEPLIGFIAEIDKGLSEWIGSVPAAKNIAPTLRRYLGAAKKEAIPLLAEVCLKKLSGFGMQELTERLNVQDASEENTAKSKPIDLDKAISKVVERALKAHSDKKVAIKLFKAKLAVLVEEIEKASGNQMPMFIFIDELDRCRPSYAIELLEGIKHLFGVRGIYFVIGTNLTQLGHATQALYGANFDGTTYLKRFFDIDYQLQPPNVHQFAEYLFQHTELARGNFAPAQLPHGMLSPNALNLSEPALLFAMYAEQFRLSLRDQEQIAIVLEAVCQSNALNGYKIYPHYLFVLLMIRHIDSQVFEQMLTGSQTLEDTIKRLKRFTTPFFQYNDRSGTKPRLVELQSWSVAEAFHVVRRVQIPVLRRKINSFERTADYPEELVWQMNGDEMQKRLPQLHSISLYADLVRQAGQLRI